MSYLHFFLIPNLPYIFHFNGRHTILLSFLLFYLCSKPQLDATFEMFLVFPCLRALAAALWRLVTNLTRRMDIRR